jgi:hypothetical protein
MSFSICNFLYSSAASSPLEPNEVGRNILLSFLLSHMLSVCSPLRMKYQIPSPCKTTSEVLAYSSLFVSAWKSKR